METTHLSSKVIVVEEEPRVRGIPSVPTAIVGALGITERGPVGEPVRIQSFEEYQRIFGGFTRNSQLALAMMGLFENGGREVWIVRTVHYEDASDPHSATSARATAEWVMSGVPTPARLVSGPLTTFALEDGEALVLAVDDGPAAHVSFEGAAALLPSTNPGPFDLSTAAPLGLRFDEGPVHEVSWPSEAFADVSAATQVEVLAVLNAAIDGGKALGLEDTWGLASDTRGTSSRVEVVESPTSTLLGLLPGSMMGTGTVARLDAVTRQEVQARVEASVEGVALELLSEGGFEVVTHAVGAAASLQALEGTAAVWGLSSERIEGSHAGDLPVLRVQSRDPGAFADAIEIELYEAASGAPSAFDMHIYEDGHAREVFREVSLERGSERFVETVLNAPRGSRWVHASSLAGDTPGRPDLERRRLSGGRDGLEGLDDADFVGSALGITGLHAFDAVQDLTLVIAPDRATPAMHHAMLRYCEVTRSGRALAVLDPPEDHNANEIVEYVTTTAALLNTSEFGALYWPRLKVLNPQKSVLGSSETVGVAPSGVIAGVMARTDGARPGGVYDAPAGIDTGRMFGVLGFETSEVLEEAKRDLVYPSRINPLTTGPGLPRYIDGSRTLRGTGNFPYVAERRGVSFIERSLHEGLQFARHKSNTEGLRAQIRRTILGFLLTQMNNGAFRSRDPKKAFFVEIPAELNGPADANLIVARVGLATQKPAEFIVLRISPDTRALEAELASAGA